jgi:hypothetical protein
MQQIRQGDVLLVRLEQTAEEFLAESARRIDPVPRERGRLVLAEGEATGHAHVIESEEAELFQEDEELLDADEAAELYLLVHGSAAAPLVHEEHTTLDVPPGVYRVVRQREYRDPQDWDDDDWELVGD